MPLTIIGLFIATNRSIKNCGNSRQTVTLRGSTMHGAVLFPGKVPGQAFETINEEI